MQGQQGQIAFLILKELPPKMSLSLGNIGLISLFKKYTFERKIDSWSPCDETKILTETETFYPRQILPIPIPRLFFDPKLLRT